MISYHPCTLQMQINPLSKWCCLSVQSLFSIHDSFEKYSTIPGGLWLIFYSTGRNNTRQALPVLAATGETKAAFYYLLIIYLPGQDHPVAESMLRFLHYYPGSLFYFSVDQKPQSPDHMLCTISRSLNLLLYSILQILVAG